MSRTIFYSWQSDIEPNKHRYFIERCIKGTLSELEQNTIVYMEYDRDTFGLNGSPDISQTIFEKIDKCILFICDVSLIGSICQDKKVPNPNVLIELGYAVSKLGWDRVICLLDSNTGKIEDLPFDLRQKRITQFNPEIGKTEEKRISDIIALNIKDLFIDGKLFNPLNDYMKGRIDKNLLDICKQMSNMLFGTVSMSEGLSHVKEFLQMSPALISAKLECAEFPGFIVFNNYNKNSFGLRDILKEILSSSYFSREWTYTVLEVLNWIQRYNNLISKRNTHYPLEIIPGKSCDDYAIILGESVNPSNPKDQYIILEIYDKDGQKYVDTHGGRVINTTQYPLHSTVGFAPYNKIYRIKNDEIIHVSNLLIHLKDLCNWWLNLTDSEFVLDPEYYVIQ